MMTEPRARAAADFFDQREYDRWLIERSPEDFWRGLAGLGAGFLGGLPDSVNFIPVFGPAARAAMIARYGRVLGRALTSAGEVGFLTAAVEPIIVREANRLGDDMTLAQAGLDIAMGVGTGFVLGGAHGLYRRWRGEPEPAVVTRLPSVRAQAAATALLDEATQAVARGERPHISPASLAAAGETIAREAGIRPAPVDDLPRGRVMLDPADRLGSTRRFVDQVFVDRHDNAPHLVYGTVDENVAERIRAEAGVETTGYTWIADASGIRHTFERHGPQSNAARSGEIPITVEDIARFDEIASAAAIVEHVRTREGLDALEFTTTINGSIVTVTAVRTGRKALALHTMYKRPWRPDAREGEAGGPAAPDTAPGAPCGLRGYTSETTASTTDAHIATPAVERQAPGGEAPGPRNEVSGGKSPGVSELEPAYREPGSSISPTESIEPPPAFDPRPERTAELAESMGLALDGAHDLDPEVRQLAAEGRLDETAAAELAAADALVARADGYAKAYEAAAICLTGRG